MKICSRCKVPKDINDFCKCSRMKDGRQAACKKCMNGSYNRSRAKKLKHYQQVKQLRIQSCIERFNLWKSTKHCILCPENDSACLDLHHTDPNEKDVNIGDVKHFWSWKRLEIELNKCVVICANCHRKVHAEKISLVDKGISIA